MSVKIIDSLPLFSVGVASLLKAALGVNVAPCELSDESHRPDADLYIIDPEIECEASPESLIEFLSRSAPVLIILPQSVSIEYKDSLLKSGAFGTVNRSATPEELLNSVRSIIKPESSCSPLKSLNFAERDSNAKFESELSERENEVLELLSIGKTHHQIANFIGISQHTVDTYVKRIRNKLQVGNKAELARVAIIRSMMRTHLEGSTVGIKFSENQGTQI